MNEIISIKDRLFMSVSGPSRSGKTDLTFQMLLRGTFYLSHYKIFYFYLQNQPKYRSFVSHNEIDIEFLKLSSFENVNKLRDCMIVFDDMKTFFMKSLILIFTAGRHKTVKMLYIQASFISAK